MHRPSVAKTATLTTASIMLPSTESRLSFEELIHRREEIFPVGSNASDHHHSLVLLIAGPLVARAKPIDTATHMQEKGLHVGPLAQTLRAHLARDEDCAAQCN
jgi:hypothetical protein